MQKKIVTLIISNIFVFRVCVQNITWKATRRRRRKIRHFRKLIRKCKTYILRFRDVKQSTQKDLKGHERMFAI